MTDKEQRAAQVYELTRSLANTNAWVGGLSGVVGSGVNLVADVAVIPLYRRLWNDVRQIYGRGEITLDAATAYLKPNIGFLAQDLFWDKLMGSIPIFGIPFNVAFGKALTWRLGAWYGLLSALGEDDIPDTMLTTLSMQLTKVVFPAAASAFSFEAPDKAKFVRFIAAQDGLTYAEAQRRLEEIFKLMEGNSPIVQPL